MNKLAFKAGKKAQQLIQEKGLQPEMIHAVAGAAGGPKWIILGGIDQFLFGHFLFPRTKSLHLIGSSIGAWRFSAALAERNPLDGLQAFKDIYFSQRYSEKFSMQEVDEAVHRLGNLLFTTERIAHIVHHPHAQLQMVTARGKGLAAAANNRIQGLSLLLSFTANAFSRRLLQGFYQRVIFKRSDNEVQLFTDRFFNTLYAHLKPENFMDALVASSAIPLVVEGIQDIQTAPKGVYRDGGLIDYHMLLPYDCPEDKIILLPHFFSQFKQGWFDKYLSYRKPSNVNLDQVLMIYPSDKFVQTLPNQRVSDRKDFTEFDNDTRIKNWNMVFDAGLHLGEELQNIIEKGQLIEQIT